MRAKNLVYLLSLLLLFSGFVYRAGALPINSVSFHGVGVTINLTFPEEAHPLDYISHNVTITANIDLTLENFTLFIYAPVNSIWQEVKNRTINWDFLASESLTSRIEFQLPQNTNGTLYCLMYVKTDQSTDYSSYTFYTTKVSTTTFSEWQSEYNKLLANYTRLQSDYETLLSEYDELLANYTSLLADYDTLVSEYNELLADYNSRVAAYESLLNNYNSLSHDYNTLNFNYQSLRDDKNELQSDYNTLNLDYNSLNSTYYSVQASYDQLKTDFGSLNRTYTDLLTEINDLNQKIAFSENALSTDRVVMFIFIITVAALVVLIMYLKRKKQEPYLVIRKETVAIKPDEKPKIEPVS